MSTSSVKQATHRPNAAVQDMTKGLFGRSTQPGTPHPMHTRNLVEEAA